MFLRYAKYVNVLKALTDKQFVPWKALRRLARRQWLEITEVARGKGRQVGQRAQLSRYMTSHSQAL
jgi:hypothetical protein